MPEIRYQGQTWHIREGENLLLGLLRQGLELRNSCRNGVCNACMMKSTKADGEELEHGRLAPELVEKGYFLPCKTTVRDFLEMQQPVNADLTYTGMVAEKEFLADDIVRIAIEASFNPEYQPGQFIDIWHPSGICRPYSLASTPMMTWYLECHIRKVEGGLVSSWLVDELAVGDEIRISKPQGQVLVPSGVAEIGLLAFGVGMSSVYGLTLDTVERMGADEPRLVRVRHMASQARGLYMDAALTALADSKPMLDYASVAGSARDPQLLADICSGLVAGDDGQRLYVLCGSDGAVQAARSWMLANGVDGRRVLADAFTFQNHPNSLLVAEAAQEGSQEAELADDERPYPATHPELWAMLEEDNRLGRILDTFYDRVFEDPIMSPYFHNSNKQRSKEKVFSFYKRLFSGEPCFFGDRPRNSHHWMVISNEVYDHRLGLLVDCMRLHGVPEDMIPMWLEYEEYYRQDIVKDEPRGRRIGGVVQPVSGLGYEVLSCGALCDSCQAVLEPGTRVLYHLRTGHIYCPQCEGRAVV
ncbi:FAD-binding oxidoreductase [Parathalassolituus penaei]|uniref:FAD-binding oxidoreductase n=1 Tax=Parathalassolituus penaei TaxID=2997323 RepID=A0A9X3EFY3_9GAMM|nr:FAD-binding oxidoreductase [Parathalassolituus penaei]MCY0966521.1 FAD-binding oxidoreductase [Parathalassolituus penaei]